MRPHWLAVWIGVAGYVWTIVRAWRWPDLADAVILTFLPLYIGPVILLVDIENYGGRMVAAAIPLAAVLAARFASTLLDSATAMTRDWSATGMPPPGENS
jgi:hypothetical protein